MTTTGALPPDGAVPIDRAPRTASRAPEALLSRPTAYLAGWGALGAVNLVAIRVSLGGTDTSLGTKVLHHGYDAGQLLAAGLLCAAVASLLARLTGTRLERVASGVLVILAAGLGILAAAEDCVGLAARLLGERYAAAGATILGAALGASVPLAYFVMERLARRPSAAVRALLVATGLALSLANSMSLERLYLGIHLAGACLAAALIGGALVGLPLGRFAPANRWDRGLYSVGRGALAFLCAWTLVIPPPNAVASQLLAVPGSVFAPFLAEARASARGNSATAEGEWFQDRAHWPDVPPSSPPLLGRDAIVLLLVIDALRAELISDDAHRAQLPRLHGLRDESLWFTRAWSPGPATGPAVAAIFAGRYYSALYWTPLAGSDKVFPHEDPTPRFPELLAQAGIATVEVASLRVFTNEWSILRGFTEQVRSDVREASAEWLVDAALARLKRQGEGPLLLHMHLMEPHAPYNRAGTEGTAYERYVREVGLADREIGRLLSGIDQLGLGDRTAVILTGDHGEAFGEHNTRAHATTMYEELVHVPLLVRVPRVAPRRIDVPVSLIDLGPTVLDLFRLPTPGRFLGQSLTELIGGGDAPLSRPIASESGYAMRSMLFPDDLKLIHDARGDAVELYDLRTDPLETRNLYDEASVDHQRRLTTLRAFFEAHEFRRDGYRTPRRR